MCIRDSCNTPCVSSALNLTTTRGAFITRAPAGVTVHRYRGSITAAAVGCAHPDTFGHAVAGTAAGVASAEASAGKFSIPAISGLLSLSALCAGNAASVSAIIYTAAIDAICTALRAVFLHVDEGRFFVAERFHRREPLPPLCGRCGLLRHDQDAPPSA